MIAGPDDVLGPDTPRRAHNLLAALVEAGEATPEEAARFARMQEGRGLFIGLLRARQAEMQGMIDRTVAWLGTETEEAMDEVAERVVEHEATHQRRRKPRQPPAQVSLL